MIDKEIKEKIKNFCLRIIKGEVCNSPEDIQLYLNYSKEIEQTLREWSEN